MDRQVIRWEDRKETEEVCQQFIFFFFFFFHPKEMSAATGANWGRVSWRPSIRAGPHLKKVPLKKSAIPLLIFFICLLIFSFTFIVPFYILPYYTPPSLSPLFLSLSLSLALSLSLLLRYCWPNYKIIYIYIYICVCVCVCVTPKRFQSPVIFFVG